MGLKSKRKGKQFEDLVAERLGVWFYNDRKAIGRTHGSGSRARMAGVEPGDICLVRDSLSEFPFTVECKHHKSWKLDGIFRGKDLSYSAYQQACEDLHATGAHKQPIVIIRGNRTPIYVIVDEGTKRRLSLGPERGYIQMPRNLGLWLALLDDFLALDPERVRTALT